MSKHPGGRFCARISESNYGKYHLECVIRFGKKPSLAKIVEQSPPYPLESHDQAANAARSIADLEGFSSEEIVWE